MSVEVSSIKLKLPPVLLKQVKAATLHFNQKGFGKSRYAFSIWIKVITTWML